MTGRGRALLHHTALLARDAWTALRGALGRVSFGTWAGVAGGLAASGWLLALPGGPPTGTALLVPFTSVEGMARLGGAALAGAWAILLLHTGTVAVDPSARGGRGRDLLRLLVGCVVVAAVLLVLSDGAGAAVVTGQEAPPAPAPVSTAPDLKAVLDNARNWLMGILATIATFFFTLGGARYLSANGDPGEVERAKGSFRNAALGYGLAVLAPLLLKALRSVVGA